MAYCIVMFFRTFFRITPLWICSSDRALGEHKIYNFFSSRLLRSFSTRPPTHPIPCTIAGCSVAGAANKMIFLFQSRSWYFYSGVSGCVCVCEWVYCIYGKKRGRRSAVLEFFGSFSNTHTQRKTVRKNLIY